MKKKNNHLLIILKAIIILMTGIGLGFITGMSYTLNKVSDYAAKFVTIDPTLIAECVQRQGLT